MAYSSGTFSRLFDWTDDRDNGIKIRADRFDQELDGFATGLSTALLKDGTQTATAKIPFAAGLSVIDNQTVLLGTNSDIAIQYDESTNDSLEIAANVEGAALNVVLKADQGDDNADQHKLSISDGGTLTLGSKISGSFVTYLTHTPNATVASSTTAVAGNLTVGGDATITGDLTITGDDLTMATNTSGHLLIADGTNFNPVSVTSLSAITTVASDDVLIAVDTSGGGLKKITRNALVSGLAAGTMSNIVEDTSPQLGGDLDTNSNNILIDDAHGIQDDSGNEFIVFQKTSSAVNQFDITNAATGNSPELSATGGDTNISLKITPKGSGQVLLDGNVGIESGVIDLKNSGSQSYVRFYCESANAHYVQVTAPAHADFSGNISIVLPATAGTLALTSQLPTSGISSGNVATFGSGVADDDFLRVNGTTIEGRSASELISDIGAVTEATAESNSVALAIALG